jgi:hypothetical protein
LTYFEDEPSRTLLVNITGVEKKIYKTFFFSFQKASSPSKKQLRIQEKEKDKTETGSRWRVTPCNKPDYRKRALLNVMMDRLGSQENWVIIITANKYFE